MKRRSKIGKRQGIKEKKELVKVKITKSIVADVLEELSEEQRVVAVGYYFDKKEVKKLAEECEHSESTIGNLLYEVNGILNHKLAEYEEKHGYRLYPLNSKIMYLAFETLFRRKGYRLSEKMTRNVYHSSCASLGLEAEKIRIRRGKFFHEIGIRKRRRIQ